MQTDNRQKTNRPTVDLIDSILGDPFPLLDHGFIRVIDYMGDDAAITQAARVSYGKGTKSTSEDKGLINYLMRHHHSTPFEMCEIKFHVKLPIFVARQWVRHRMANINEYSARYSILDKEFYIPEAAQLAPQSSANKQGRAGELTPEEAAYVQQLLIDDANRSYEGYEHLLNQRDGETINPAHEGISRELARMNLSLNYYTQWYWKVDLHNLFNFLRLRADSHAQYEIRVYAEKMNELVKLWVPYAQEAFEEHRLYAKTFSRKELNLLSPEAWVHHTKPENFSDGEWREFQKKIGL